MNVPTASESTHASKSAHRQRWVIPQLLWWQIRPLVVVSVAGSVLALSYVMLRHEPLVMRMYEVVWSTYPIGRSETINPAIVFVLVHCLCIVFSQGRTRCSPFGFLYSQGFSRRTLWCHSMLVSLGSVLIVCLPAALAVWCGFRAYYQDRIENPWFPFMAPLESSYPIFVLMLYFLVLPALNYAWVRSAQPWRGSITGYVVAGVMLVAIYFVLKSRHVWPETNGFGVGMLITLSLASFVLLIGGARLHERIEVRS
jgi:hypothetical protein